MKTITRRLLAFAPVYCLAVPAFAQISTVEYSLDIERQPVTDALIEFSEQTGLQIGYFPETLSTSMFVGPLSGHYTVDMAITQFLAPGALLYERVNDRTIIIAGAASTQTEGSRFVTRERGTYSTPSFVRLAATHQDGFQESQTTENVRKSGSRSKPAAIEEVIVTAQKRAERLQDVPISISVIGGDDLDRSTARDITEVLNQVPGVSISEIFAGGLVQVPVRGVAAQVGTDNGSSPTAYYLDSAPFGFAKHAFGPDPDVYDLERVEVLRGPQGTLYGASALNGVVRVLAREADLDEFELKMRGLTSNTEGGDWNYRGDMAVNAPIIDGKLAARAVLGYQELSGWIDKPHQKEVNDAERLSARLKIGAQPTEQFSMGLSFWHSQADYGAPSVGFERGRNSSPVDEPISTDYDVFGLKMGYESPWFSITSATSYLEFAYDYRLDVGTVLEGTLDADTFAQEIALNSTHGGSWRWTIGGIYRDSEDRDFAILPDLLDILPAPQIARNSSESSAVFGELTRIFLAGKLEFTAGLRYFEDNLTQSEHSRFSGEPQEQLIDSDATFSATTPRFVLTWHPSEQMTVYASYSEGFRSGWHQLPITVIIADLPPVKPDRLTNYELGAKGSLWGRRLNFDAALYYMDWQDVQQSLAVFIPDAGFSTAAGINGESASGLGFDLALTAAPIDALELAINFSWNDLTVDADVFSGGVLLFGKGDRLNTSAEYTVGASADYFFPIGGGFEGRFSASANYTSEQESRSETGGVITFSSGDPMLIGRTSLSLRAPDHWVASLYVDNINNEQGSPQRTLGGPNSLLYVRPRTTGVQLEYRF